MANFFLMVIIGTTLGLPALVKRDQSVTILERLRNWP